jgi:serine/threonine protein kinase
MPLNDGETFAGFRIVRLLGSGGMGEVYLAQHPRLPRRDALKLLPPDWSADQEYRTRFKREADLASTLWHGPEPPPRDSGCPPDIRFYTQLIVAYPTASAPPEAAVGNADNPVYTQYNGMPAYRWNSLTPRCHASDN